MAENEARLDELEKLEHLLDVACIGAGNPDHPLRKHLAGRRAALASASAAETEEPAGQAEAQNETDAPTEDAVPSGDLPASEALEAKPESENPASVAQ